MIERYQRRAAEHAVSRNIATQRSIRISRLRLATFLPGAAAMIWGLARGADPLLSGIGLALLLVFAVLVVWHARVDERVERHDALVSVNEIAIARIARAWDRLPPAESPPPASLEHHPYALDLDLFGRASLMQWLGPASTAAGTRTLHAWLLEAAGPEAILSRQQAVAELAPSHDWREQLGGLGRLASGVRQGELDRFLAWAESDGPFLPSRARLLRLTVLALTGSIWLLIALHAAAVIATALWLIPVAAGVVLSFATVVPVHGTFTRAGAGQSALSRYADLFAHATAAPAGAPLLAAIQSGLSASGRSAPDCMRRLNRILDLAHLRSGAGIFHFLIQALTLWDFHVFFALDRWRVQVGSSVRGWMRALGELDALSAFAQISADNPAWCQPVPVSADGRFVAADLGHPLIFEDRRVGNDVAIGPPGTVLLITGSNMSGKSTLLRAIGLNTVLAQAGAPACAQSLRLPPVDLETSIRVQDSLEHGLSYFMAALARLKGIVDRARPSADSNRVLLYLLDEILQGTNTVERAIAVRGVVRHLLDAGAIGAVTTHDLGVAAEEPLDTAATLVHFTELVDGNGNMTFDYRLRPGLATSRNALRLMHLIGLDFNEDATPSEETRSGMVPRLRSPSEGGPR